MSGSHRILVVDDEPDLLRMVEMYLKAWNFEFDGFTDPVQALAHFEKNPSFFSLVLTDVRMPGMSGLELASQILKIKPETKILIMTAYDITEFDLQSKHALIGHKDVLKKPFRLAEICRAVKKELALV